MKRWIWGIIIAAIFVIQLIPSGRPEVIDDNPKDLLLNHQVPDTVAKLFRAACYDCHSNETQYPWYAYVAPVSWLVTRDTKNGRSNLNFSEWENHSKMDMAKHLADIAEEVEDGTMPMPIYVLMHPEAKLTKAQRDALVEWSDSFAESMFE